MLRNILMIFGFIIAVLPYAGLPYDFTKWVWTLLGLAIVFLLFFSQKGKPLRSTFLPLSNEQSEGENIRELEVVRHEVETHPDLRIEKDSIVHVVLQPTAAIEVATPLETTKPQKRKKKITETFTDTPDQPLPSE